MQIYLSIFFITQLKSCLIKIYHLINYLNKKDYKCKYKPWITCGILTSMKRRNKLFEKYIRTKDILNKSAGLEILLFQSNEKSLVQLWVQANDRQCRQIVSADQSLVRSLVPSLVKIVSANHDNERTNPGLTKNRQCNFGSKSNVVIITLKFRQLKVPYTMNIKPSETGSLN